MTDQRLPAINGDQGQWGIILNQYLSKEHYDTGSDNTANGGHKNVTIQPGTSSLAPLTLMSGTNLTTPAAGSVEYDGTYFYLTPGTTRKQAVLEGVGSGYTNATGDLLYRDSGGNYKQLPVGGTNALLTTASGVPAWSGANAFSTTPSNGALAQWDSNKDLSANVFIKSIQSTANSGTTTILDNTSAQVQVFTGTTSSQTVRLPTTSITAGQSYTIINQATSGTLSIQSSDTSSITIIAAKSVSVFTAQKSTPTGPSDWVASVAVDGKLLTLSNSLTVNGGNDGTLAFGAASKTLTVKRSITLDAGADNQTMTFPSTSATIAGTNVSQSFSGTQTFSGTITVPTPANPTDAATKSYVDSSIQGLDVKNSAVAATTGSETFTISSGTVTQIAGTTIDGVSPAVNDRILIKDAPASTGIGSAFSTQPGNGIYTVSSNTTNLSVSRVTDQSGSNNPQGDFIFVEGGTINAAAGFVVTTPSTTGSFTFGTNNIKWTQFSGAGEISAGAGLTKSGNTLSIENSGVLTASHGGTGANSLTGVVIGNGTSAMTTVTAPSGAIVGTSDSQILTNKTLSTGTVITGLPTGSGVDSAATASTLAARDSNANLTADTFIKSESFTTTGSGGGVTSMDINSTQVQVFGGTLNHTVLLPSTGIKAGQTYTIINQSSGVITVQASDGSVVGTLSVPCGAIFLTGADNPTSSGNWGGFTLPPNQTFVIPVNGSSVAANPNTVAVRDANANIAADRFIKTETGTPASGGTLTLDVTSSQVQTIYGSGNHTVVLPYNGIFAGQTYTIINQTSGGTVTVKANDGNTVATLDIPTGATFLAGADSPSNVYNWGGISMPPSITQMFPSGGVSIASTGQSLVERDGHSNLYANSFIEGLTTTVTSASPYTLVVTSSQFQQFTGSTAQTVYLPDATTLAVGQSYTITNRSSAVLTVKLNDTTTVLQTMAAGSQLIATVVTKSTTNGTWDAAYSITTPANSAPTASTIAEWDSNSNLSANVFIPGTASHATASGTLSLSLSSPQVQIFTGSTTGQLISLPTTAVVAGQSWTIINQSSVAVTIQSSSPAIINIIPAASSVVYTAKVATPTAANDWYSSPLQGSRYNTVNNPTATPSINTTQTDTFVITGLAVNITSMTTNLSGNPIDGQKLTIRIKGAASQTIAWGASFAASGTVSLLTTTVAGKAHTVGFMYDASAAVWVCMASDPVGY